jgi:phage gpG-like protein
MLDISIKIDTKDIENILPNFKSGILKGMKQSMLYAEGASKKRFGTQGNLQVRTGRLRNSIVGEAHQEDNDTYVGSIGTSVIYGPIHETGGVIRAKNGPYLKFRVDGHWVSKKEVTIPARPFLRPAITENISRIRDIIIDSIIKEVEK